MKRLMSSFTVLLLVMALALPALAFIPQGELNGGVSYEWNAEDKKLEHTSTRTGFRLVLEDYVDPAGKLHFSFKGWYDWKDKEGDLALDQLWFSGYMGDIDYSLGRQLISWGTADGFNPTSYFARMDANALFSGDMAGEPTWAGQATYYGQNFSLTAVAAPYFEPQKIDAEMKRLMPKTELPPHIPPGLVPDADAVFEAIEEVDKPKAFGKDTQWALRAETQLAGFDLQASYFTGYEPLPGMEMTIQMFPPNTSFEGEYRRQSVVGLAASGTIGSAGVWAEVAYGGPEPFAEADDVPGTMRIPLSINEKYLQAVVGGDYTFAVGTGLLAQIQYIYRGQGSLLMPYVMPEIDFEAGPIPSIEPGEIKPASYLYGRFAYDVNPDSTLDLVVIYGLEEKGGIIRPAYTYRFPNAVQAELSLVASFGKEENVFEPIPTTARLGVSYKF